jgi:hypothetical protein
MATIAQKIRGRLVAIVVLGVAMGLVFFLSSNWTTWAGRLQRLRAEHSSVAMISAPRYAARPGTA